MAAAAANDEVARSPALLAANVDEDIISAIPSLPEGSLPPPAEFDKPAEEVLKMVESGLRLDVLDCSGSGTVSVLEIHNALRDLLGLSVHDDNKTLAEYVHAHADITGNGVVTTEDFEQFCNFLPGALGEYYSRSNSGTGNGEEKNRDGDDEEEGLLF